MLVCPHIEGVAWAGTPIYNDLQPWEIFILAALFGWLRPDGTRRFRNAYLSVAKKNGKTLLCAAIALYLLANDGEPGAQVYSAATNYEQAAIVWNAACEMVRRSPELTERLQVWAHAIQLRNEHSLFRPFHSKSKSVDGFNPSGGIIDELHAHTNKGMLNIIRNATGARVQGGGSPLILIITTRGDNLEGPCMEEDDYSQKILNGSLRDDSFFAIIFTLDEGDDWADESVWPKANPNLGVSVSLDELRDHLRRAQASPTDAADFQTKKCNRWVGALSAYFNVQKWTKLGREPILDELRQARLYIGCDLAAKLDLNAVVWLFRRQRDGTRKVRRRTSGYTQPGVYEEIEVPVFGFYLIPHLFVPEATARDPHNKNGERYRKWAAEGWLTLTDGNVVDYDRILDSCRMAREFDLVEMALDPGFQAWQFAQDALKENLPVIEVPQQVKHLSEPMKELKALIEAGLIEHDGNPCFTWMLGNVIAKIDAKENVYPRKRFDFNKIDGPVAAILASNRAMVRQESGGMKLIL